MGEVPAFFFFNWEWAGQGAVLWFLFLGCVGSSLLCVCVWTSLVVEQALEGAGSVLRCVASLVATCGIFAPQQGSNPRPLHWKAEPYAVDHRGSPKDVIDSL